MNWITRRRGPAYPDAKPAPPLPEHLEGCLEICGYSPDPSKARETACARSVVPFGPVSHHRALVTCPACVKGLACAWADAWGLRDAGAAAAGTEDTRKLKEVLLDLSGRMDEIVVRSAREGWLERTFVLFEKLPISRVRWSMWELIQLYAAEVSRRLPNPAHADLALGHAVIRRHEDICRGIEPVPGSLAAYPRHVLAECRAYMTDVVRVVCDSRDVCPDPQTGGTAARLIHG